MTDYCLYYFPLEYKKNEKAKNEFLKLTLDEACELLDDPWLNVISEEDVIQMIDDWISYNSKKIRNVHKARKALNMCLKITEYNVTSLIPPYTNILYLSDFEDCLQVP